MGCCAGKPAAQAEPAKDPRRVAAQEDNRAAQVDFTQLLCDATPNNEANTTAKDRQAIEVVLAALQSDTSSENFAEFARQCNSRLGHSSVPIKLKTIIVMQSASQRGTEQKQLHWGPDLNRAMLVACGETLTDFATFTVATRPEYGDKPGKAVRGTAASLLAHIRPEPGTEPEVAESDGEARARSGSGAPALEQSKSEMKAHLMSMNLRVSLNQLVDTLAEGGYEDAASIDAATLEDLESLGFKKPQLVKVTEFRNARNTGPRRSVSAYDDVPEEGVPDMTRTHSTRTAGVGRLSIAEADRSAFASLRFDGVVNKPAEALQTALKQLGVSLVVINMKGGGDIDAAVIAGIERCNTFVVFGSAKYGENTGNNACTYFESKFAQSQKKRIILIRMIPFDEDFEEPQARFMFGLNKLELSWMQGEPMPADLPAQIIDAMGL